MNTFFTFVIPTHQRRDYLLELLDSIYKQTFKSFDVIVIDDNSSDSLEVRSLVNDLYPSVQYLINDENVGPSASRLRGLLAATGKYVIFADDDDFYFDFNFLSSLYDLTLSGDYSFVSFNSKKLIDETKEIIPNLLNSEGIHDGKEFFLKFQLSMDKPLSTFTTCFKRENLIKSVNLNNTFINDSTIYLMALAYGRCRIDASAVGYYRIHNFNITKSISEKFIEDSINSKLIIGKQFLSNKKEYKHFANSQIKLTISYYSQTASFFKRILFSLKMVKKHHLIGFLF